MAEKAKQVQSPITLFVQGVDFKPALEHGSERVTVIDLEITEMDAQKLAEGLMQRLDREAVFGAIRVRFTGRLVL